MSCGAVRIEVLSKYGAGTYSWTTGRVNMTLGLGAVRAVEDGLRLNYSPLGGDRPISSNQYASRIKNPYYIPLL